MTTSGYWQRFGEKKVSRRRLLAGTAAALGASGLALAGCLASPLWTARVYWGELSRYQRWAQFWDRRDSVLRQSSRQGELDVHVMEIDHIIPRVGELSPQPDAWYNQCASIYYRLHTISADLPGWDE